jgi:transposase
LLAVIVLPANVQDRDGAKTLFMHAAGMLTSLKTIWADGAYAGQLIDWVQAWCGWTLEIVKRLKDTAGFTPLRKRWIVERTFAWLSLSRRLSKDYEYLEASSEAMVRIRMVQCMLHRRFRPQRSRARKRTAASS